MINFSIDSMFLFQQIGLFDIFKHDYIKKGGKTKKYLKPNKILNKMDFDLENIVLHDKAFSVKNSKKQNINITILPRTKNLLGAR